MVSEQFKSIVLQRINDHKVEVALREEETRERIRKEELERIEREQAATLAAHQKEAAALAASVQSATETIAQKAPEPIQSATPVPAPAANVVPMRAAAPAPAAAPATPPTLKLGQIGERLGFSLTGDFLKSLGFEPAARDKSALLFHERDFPLICAALVTHIQAVQAKQAA